jgi:hypothetical protein
MDAEMELLLLLLMLFGEERRRDKGSEDELKGRDVR